MTTNGEIFRAHGTSMPLTLPKATDSTPRVNKLDSLRFVAAFWVAMSHGALPLQEVFPEANLHRLFGAFNSLFDGVAAVMVFFIVSGFCIHLPYVNARKLPLIKFIIRRYIRIGIPLIVILLIMQLLGGAASGGGHAVLWSIYAETIYYTIYPLLFALYIRVGWGILIGLSGVISIAMTLTHLTDLWLWQFGSLTWLWGLPIWLSGCALAEGFRTRSLFNVYGSVWLWRLAALAFGTAANFGVFHAQVRISYPVSMLVFAIFTFFWLSLEMRTQTGAWRLLESFGGASYSLSLVHNVALGGIADYLKLLPSTIAIVFPWTVITATTYIFYKVVELPSHFAARWAASVVSDLIARKQSSKQSL